MTDAHLNVETHAGEAWVNLHARLGQAPFPWPLQSHNQRHQNSPSRQRRRARRATARQSGRTNNVETGEVESGATEAEEANKDSNENETTTAVEVAAVEVAAVEAEVGLDVNEVTDEICPDSIYNVDKPPKEVKIAANTDGKLIIKHYPKDCEDCGKHLRNHDDLRKHIEACMIAKYCK